MNECDCMNCEELRDEQFPTVSLMLLLTGQGIIWGLIGFFAARFVYA